MPLICSQTPGSGLDALFKRRVIMSHFGRHLYELRYFRSIGQLLPQDWNEHFSDLLWFNQDGSDVVMEVSIFV